MPNSQQLIAQFRQKYGAAWYQIVNGEVFRAALEVTKKTGPLSTIIFEPAERVTDHGTAYTANIQGFETALHVLSEVLTGSEDQTGDIGAPTYEPIESPNRPLRQRVTKPRKKSAK
jgi:hypothetical protein